MQENFILLNKKVDYFNELYIKYESANSINLLELKESICDVLSWIEICIKFPTKLDKLSTKKISAIRYINNIKKHNYSIFEYTLNSLGLYPLENLYPSNDLYPSSFDIIWAVLPLDDMKYENQYNNYKTLLEGRNVRETINEVFKIIKNNFC